MFRYISQQWNSNVHYICVSHLSPDRRNAGWKDCDHGKALVTILSDKPEPITFLKTFIDNHSNSIHVINGFRSLASPYIKKYLLPVPNVKIASWSERPNVSGNVIQKLIRHIGAHVVYRYYSLKYLSKISVYLPLGVLGIKDFKKYGFNSQTMFPFMYNPIVPPNLLICSKNNTYQGLRFLYVGRFSKRTKGLDILIDAVNNLHGKNWEVHLVGGYGDFKDYTISWAKNHPNVSFLGTWPSSEICERMSKYDVVLSQAALTAGMWW